MEHVAEQRRTDEPYYVKCARRYIADLIVANWRKGKDAAHMSLRAALQAHIAVGDKHAAEALKAYELTAPKLLDGIWIGQ